MIVSGDYGGTGHTFSTEEHLETTLSIEYVEAYPPWYTPTVEIKEKPEPNFARFQNSFKRNHNGKISNHRTQTKKGGR